MWVVGVPYFLFFFFFLNQLKESYNENEIQQLEEEEVLQYRKIHYLQYESDEIPVYLWIVSDCWLQRPRLIRPMKRRG